MSQNSNYTNGATASEVNAAEDMEVIESEATSQDEGKGLSNYWSILGGGDEAKGEAEQPMEEKKESGDLDSDFVEWNAVQLQAWWRMVQQRQLFLSLKQAIGLIQRSWKGFSGGQKHQEFADEEAKAMIWKCWLRYRDRKTFQTIRDMLYAHQHADPQVMLASLAPVEAPLMDEASGLHVRLRLGGISFPPQILFKVFTHRPVTDIGAFAPRNYDLEAKLAAVTTDRTDNATIATVEKCLWYQRDDNNGWRPVLPRNPVNETLLLVERRSAPLKRPFEYCHYKRRQAVAQEAKERKRMWLRQMYAMGRQQDQKRVLNSAHNRDKLNAMGELSDDDNSEGFDDWGEEELLRWTENLDFEAYQKQWASTATLIPHLDVEDIDAFLPL